MQLWFQALALIPCTDILCRPRICGRGSLRQCRPLPQRSLRHPRWQWLCKPAARGSATPVLGSHGNKSTRKSLQSHSSVTSWVSWLLNTDRLPRASFFNQTFGLCLVLGFGVVSSSKLLITESVEKEPLGNHWFGAGSLLSGVSLDSWHLLKQLQGAEFFSFLTQKSLSRGLIEI